MKQKYEVCLQFWKNSLKDHFGIGYTVCNKGLANKHTFSFAVVTVSH